MGSQRPWRIIVTPKAEREFKRAPAGIQARTRVAIDALAAGIVRSDVRKLHGEVDQWRLRVGDWRVFFTCRPRERAIYILGVRHRREAYRL